MTELEKRKIARLEKNIQETADLLEDWEEQKRLASNPTERKRSEREVERFQKMLEEYEAELKTLKQALGAQETTEPPQFTVETHIQLTARVKNLLHENYIQEALETMLMFFEKQNDSPMTVWVGTQLGRLKQVESDYGEGILTYEQLMVEKNRMRKTILGKL